MADGKDGSSGGAESAGKSTDVKIEIELGDGTKKSFGAEDVKNLVSQQASVTQKAQELASVSKILAKYGVDAETYLGQSEQALALVGDALAKGLIDEKGQWKQAEVKPPAAQDPLAFLKKAGGDKGDGGDGGEKTLKIVESALGKLDDLGNRLKAIEQDQAAILRDQITSRVMKRYPNFTEENVSELLVRGSKDSRKSLWDHAEDFNKDLGTRQEQLEQAVAKKYGIDLEAARNKLKETGAEGGASAMFQGKKFSFGKGPRDNKEGHISPLDATIEFLRKAKG